MNKFISYLYNFRSNHILLYFFHRIINLISIKRPSYFQDKLHIYFLHLIIQVDKIRSDLMFLGQISYISG